MPLIQYFGYVGSFLLATILAASWCFPATVQAPSSDVPLDEKITIRIHSAQKWPERVEFDTADPVPGSAANAALVAEGAPDQKPDDAGNQSPFEAFAKMTPNSLGICFRPPCSTGERRRARRVAERERHLASRSLRRVDGHP